MRQVVFDQLSPAAQTAIRDISAQRDSDSSSANPPEAVVAVLVEDFNNVINQSPLLESPDTALPIEREAKRMLKLGNLNQREAQQLNRLILEAAFPDGIRKLSSKVGVQ
jgi:hypothetical protein